MLQRRSHPANDKVRQWLLTDDYASLAITNAKEMKISGATKVSQKQGEALMASMDLNVEEDLGADLAEDFEEYDGALQEIIKSMFQCIFRDILCVMYITLKWCQCVLIPFAFHIRTRLLSRPLLTVCPSTKRCQLLRALTAALWPPRASPPLRTRCLCRHC